MQFEMPASRPLCAPCQTVMNNDALAVLVRRNDFGGSILCHLCRQQIFSENATVAEGQKSFVFENPAKPLTQAQTPTQTQTQSQTQTPCSTDTSDTSDTSAEDTTWYCQRCSARVWANPRAFLGDIEPETWRWCRVCISEHEREKPDELQRQYADKQRITGSVYTRNTSASQNKNARKRKRHEVQSNTLNSWCKNFDPIVQRKS